MPTAAEVAPIRAALTAVQAGSPLTHGALTAVPLLIASAVSEPDWVTVAEAGDAVTITELDAAGSVPELRVTNQGDRPVLFLDGEELLGAKQNRVLNTAVLVAAHSTVTIPVSCVEQGRWAYRGQRFSSSDGSLFASLRRTKADRVSQSLREGRGHASDQGEIWRGLHEKAAASGVESPTGAMHAFFEEYGRDVAAARSALAPVHGQVGVVVYVSGQWMGLDLLPGPGLFERAWPRLCSGYAAESVGKHHGDRLEPDPHGIRALVMGAVAESALAVGLGQEYRLGGRVSGAALVVDDLLAHLAAFPALDRD